MILNGDVQDHEQILRKRINSANKEEIIFLKKLGTYKIIPILKAERKKNNI